MGSQILKAESIRCQQKTQNTTQAPAYSVSTAQKFIEVQFTRYSNLKKGSQGPGEGGRSGRLGQCPKFSRFLILEASLICYAELETHYHY